MVDQQENRRILPLSVLSAERMREHSLTATSNLGKRITHATFQGTDPAKRTMIFTHRENTAPATQEEADARISQQLSDRFKQISIRNIKNNSTAGSGLRGKGTGRRRVLDGMKKLVDIGASPTNKLAQLKSPQAQNSLMDNEPSYQNTMNLTGNLASQMESINKKNDADETYMFMNRLDRIRGRTNS